MTRQTQTLTCYRPAPRRRDRATALVLVILISVVIAGLVLTISMTAGVTAQNAGKEQDIDQSYYAAEAGLQKGILQLKTSFANRSAIAQTNLNYPNGSAAGKYAVTFTSSGSPVTVTSTGASGLAQTILSCSVTQNSSGPGQITIGGSFSAVAGTIDSFDSSLGSYGGANVGAHATLTTNTTASGGIQLGTKINGNILIGAGGNPNNVVSAWGAGGATGTITAQSSNTTMPTVTMPTGMPASSGALSLSNSASQTWSSNMRYSSISMSNNTVINVTGNVVVEVDGAVNLSNYAAINIASGGSLTLYVNGGFAMNSNATVNMNADGSSGTPANCKINVLGSNSVSMTNSNKAAAQITAPNSSLSLTTSAQFYGSFVGSSVSQSNSTGFHVDTATGGGSGGGGGATLSIASYSLTTN